MPDFADRLREEIEYSGLLQKEIAARAGIKKRALDMYLGVQKSMPPADVAVRIASALGVTVEYLVTGKEEGAARPQAPGKKPETRRNRRSEALVENLNQLPPEVRNSITGLVDAIVRMAAPPEGDPAGNGGQNAP